MQLVDEGTTQEIVNNYKGAIQLEGSHISEVMWMTKFFGNYNIYKMFFQVTLNKWCKNKGNEKSLIYGYHRHFFRAIRRD